MSIDCRLLPYECASGPSNMARDEALLESAAQGNATLRFYGWSVPTVSLGYFQSSSWLADDPLLKSLPWVRRATGGHTLIHHHELTYALAVPLGHPWHNDEPWPHRLHTMIREALAKLGVNVQAFVKQCSGPFQGKLCFAHPTCGDLVLDTAKITGSAQRKHRRAMLQHGAVLLAQSEFAPSLPGLLELTGRRLSPPELEETILTVFRATTGWNLVPGTWSEMEQHHAHVLELEKYTRAEWNEKR